MVQILLYRPYLIIIGLEFIIHIHELFFESTISINLLSLIIGLCWASVKKDTNN